MRLAFCLFHYFPFGGLQRDFLAISKMCLERGHDVSVYLMAWEGDIPEGIHIHKIPVKGITNHRRCLSYVKKLKKILEKEKYDCVIGFNKMPFLDIYFASDVCFQAKARRDHGFLYRLTPRYLAYKKLEKSVFHKDATTQILILTENEKLNFIRYYKTPYERFHLLPAGVEEHCIATPDAKLISHELRDEFSIATHDYLLLMVASDFKTKGLDRCLHALNALPREKVDRIHFFVIGDGDEKDFLPLIRKFKLSSRVVFLGPRLDLPRFYMAADILLHPARTDSAGKVLLEALACGLPIVATAACGYAYHIQLANAGVVLSSPFVEAEFNRHLFSILNHPEERQRWKKNALSYIAGIDLFNLANVAVEKIEQTKVC
ncbi:MAG: hypothetical protein A3F17_04620 [Gammaproteobacteria bacterium RIFCSPHIGHO2_12_FULL_41_15]|nr:MAG: hypothetical protein A3F17_04620 [Gammaproteobacteria bacterium RIFCSPHIGHO2_12_FULL_41_15]